MASGTRPATPGPDDTVLPGDGARPDDDTSGRGDDARPDDDTARPGGRTGAGAAEPLLVVEGLAVDFFTREGTVRVVEDVSFTLAEGETFGLVGESGSGKTVTSLAVLGMIGPPTGRVPEGSVRLDGRELRGLPPRRLQGVRGREVAMIFQEPRRSLDPAFTVGDQIAETVRAHLGVPRRDGWRRAVEMLDLVGIASAERRAREYPHQFSGGMAQRVMLAIALCCSPRVLIADEPTTALDVTVQSQVLALIRDLQEEMGLAVLFISHDLGVVAEMCDRVAVMYAGHVVEQAPAEDLFLRPRHPYTAALLESIPSADVGSGRLAAIPGTVPPAHDWPTGCRFHPRCAHAVDACRSETPVPVPAAAPAGDRAGDPVPAGEGRTARCLRADDLALEGVR